MTNTLGDGVQHDIVGGRQVCDHCHAGRPGPDPSLPYGKARCDNCGGVMVVDR